MVGIKGKSGIYKRKKEDNKKLSETRKRLFKKGEIKKSNSCFKKGCIPWNKGLNKEDDKRVRKYIKKMIETKQKRNYQAWNKGFKGYHAMENHWNWRGGKSFESYTVDWTETLKKAIRERDKYTCQLCNSYGIDVHHIDYNKKNISPNNLITLCRSCHVKTNFKRSFWKNFFGGMERW